MNKALILVVEDDRPIRNLIVTTLKTHDYKYITAENGSSAILEASSHKPEIILLDLGLPDMEGVDVIKKVRTWSNVPIIVISARSEDVDKIEALDAGADDYVTIPYKLKDIESKIQSVYKNGILKPRRIYRYKDIVVDTTARTCSCANKPLNLTKNEFKLLTILISHPYQPFSISYLFEEVWGSSIYEDGTSIPGLMSNLIMKLRLINNDQEYIKRFGKDSYKMAF